MGCGQSKNQVGIVPGGNAPTPRPPVKVERPNSKTIRVKATDSTDTSKVTVSDPNTPSRSIKPKKLLAKRDTWTGSQDSLGGGFKDNGRGGSASSKFSSHSQDSGFDCGEELSSHIITEDSDIDKIRQVEEAWQSPRDLDLGVVGKAVTQRSSAKDKERLQEQRILASLRDEGLISRQVGKASGGVCFEVVQDHSRLPPLQARPPARLEKLEKRKKKKKHLTEEQIKEKLEKASARRKELEQERLEKIQQVTNKSDVKNALDSFAEMQKKKEEVVKTKEEIAAENRENRLREAQERLQKKKEHAEKVRQRKMLAMPADENDNLEPMPVNSQRFSEDTPVGVSVEA